jgi:UDP-N-acetylglucosamine 4,6-dehydratase
MLIEYIKLKLISSSRKTKKIIIGTSDFLLVLNSILFAIYISKDEIPLMRTYELLILIWFPTMTVLIFYISGVYRSVLRFIDFSVIRTLSKAIIVAFTLNLLINTALILISSDIFKYNLYSISISAEGWVVSFLSTIVLVIGSRVIANYFFLNKSSEKRVVIYGAGSAGLQLAGALRVSSEMQTVAFIDQNNALHNTFLGGVKVLHPKKLQRLVARKRVDEVLIAMPSASKSVLRNLLKEIEDYSIKVRILPGLAELAQGKILVSELKEVDVSDLLGRLEVEANQDLINRNIAQKVVLITGAGGSIGSEISRQVARKASKVILLDANEYALYSIKNEIENLLPETDLHAVLGNVTNKKRITEICKVFAVDTVYHAAAYKHVSLVEENPFEGVINNIIGTQACVQAAMDAEVDTFVLISTDKAVRPTNIMGATKRFAEMILQSLSNKDGNKNKTRITMVRFGNVIGSSGSAIPLFQQQIKEGGPVTVTHSEVIRYFMSIPEAAELVIQAGAMGKGGDVFVLDMGDPIKIYDLAKRLISLSGMELKDKDNPEGDIEIIFTGLRPGEKLYEELLIGESVSTTEHKRILRAEEDFLTYEELEKYLILLKKAEKEGDVLVLKEILREVISGFTPENETVDVLSLQKKN